MLSRYKIVNSSRPAEELPYLTDRIELLSKLYTHHSGKCAWCDIAVILPGEANWYKGNPSAASIDHLKTRRMGRKDYWDGGHVLSCHSCNQILGQNEQYIWNKWAEEEVELQKEMRKAVFQSIKSEISKQPENTEHNEIKFQLELSIWGLRFNSDGVLTKRKVRNSQLTAPE